MSQLKTPGARASCTPPSTQLEQRTRLARSTGDIRATIAAGDAKGCSIPKECDERTPRTDAIGVRRLTLLPRDHYSDRLKSMRQLAYVGGATKSGNVNLTWVAIGGGEIHSPVRLADVVSTAMPCESVVTLEQASGCSGEGRSSAAMVQFERRRPSVLRDAVGGYVQRRVCPPRP